MNDSTPSKRYSKNDISKIRQMLADGRTHQEIATAVGRSRGAIRNWISANGLSDKDRPWSNEDLETLIAAYSSNPGLYVNQADLAQKLGRTRNSIQMKAGKLGLTDKDRKTVAGPKSRRKFATDDELRAFQSETTKARRVSDPTFMKPALGLRHSDETKKKLSEASLRGWESVTPQELERRRIKTNATKIERYGTTAPASLNAEQPYSRSAGGKREDLGNTYFRSAWEANYARYLNWLIEQGQIQSWTFEEDTFVFHGETRGAIAYRPDFKVIESDGSIVYHEVKGWMDGPSKTRLRRMKKHYPDVKIIIIGEVEYKAISKWRDLIPNWEVGKKKF